MLKELLGTTFYYLPRDSEKNKEITELRFDIRNQKLPNTKANISAMPSVSEVKSVANLQQRTVNHSSLSINPLL